MSDSDTHNALGLRAGDWVRVRSAEEILSTLDERGCLDALPFMPEMLQACGRRFQVAGIAHKTCDTATRSGGRRMRNAVFLEDMRCDGAAHGGCQARCLMFWKTDWLVPEDPAKVPSDAPPRRAVCSAEGLNRATQGVTGTGEARYFCQATEHLAATEPLRPLALWHFIEDVRTGNSSLFHVIKVVGLHLLWRFPRTFGFGWRASEWLHGRMHEVVMGRPDPYRKGLIARGASTPKEELDLQPGELVEVKSHDEILKTVDVDLRNRGMKYNTELTPACGKTFRVEQRVSRIIEEHTGRMITMKNPCITLEGVYCEALYTHYSLLCTRRVTPYFREAWLKRPVPNNDR